MTDARHTSNGQKMNGVISCSYDKFNNLILICEILKIYIKELFKLL